MTDHRENAAFRDAIADAVGEHDEHMVWEPNLNRALSVLDMPEMQAIRRLIKALGESTWDAEPQLDRAWDDLPMSVFNWVEEAQ